MAARSKFSNDLWFNAAAFGGSAVLGVLLNLFIVRYHDAAALGVFNQVYAVYILLSQLAVGGVHLAVQAIAPRFQTFLEERCTLLGTEHRDHTLHRIDAP